MYHKAVADSSSLILLAKADIIDAVVKKHTIVIQKSVYRESIERGKIKGYESSYKLERLFQKNKIKIEEPSDKIKDKIESLCSLYLGEKDAVALAFEKNIAVICDDKKAINACKALKVKFATALNVLEQLHKKRVISKNKAILALENLKKYGWYDHSFTDIVKKQIRGE